MNIWDISTANGLKFGQTFPNSLIVTFNNVSNYTGRIKVGDILDNNGELYKVVEIKTSDIFKSYFVVKAYVQKGVL